MGDAPTGFNRFSFRGRDYPVSRVKLFVSPARGNPDGPFNELTLCIFVNEPESALFRLDAILLENMTCLADLIGARVHAHIEEEYDDDSLGCVGYFDAPTSGWWDESLPDGHPDREWRIFSTNITLDSDNGREFRVQGEFEVIQLESEKIQSGSFDIRADGTERRRASHGLLLD